MGLNFYLFLILLTGTFLQIDCFWDSFLKKAGPIINPNTYSGSAWRQWDQVHFQAGDVLNCYMYGPANHVLLATTPQNVIHMDGSKETNNGFIAEETWQRFHEREGSHMEKCMNIGSDRRSLSVDEAVERARSYLGGGRVYYDLYKCNCEHWVSHWISKDPPYSKQIAMLSFGHINGYTNKECPI